MNKTVQTTSRYFKRILLVSIFFLITIFFTNAHDYSGSMIVKVEQGKNDITVSVKSQKKSTVQFYMFSVDGSLVKQLNITGSSKFSIEHFSKGVYLYDLFNNDERLKSGKIELK